MIDYLEANAHQDLYIGNLVTTDAAGRGTQDEVRQVLAFRIDIDIAGDGHKLSNLVPSLEVALQVVDDYAPLPPAAIIHSGGGIQVWWFFSSPVDVTDNQQRAYVVALSHGLEAIFKRSGYQVDTVANLDRVMRLPGSLNWKTGEARPVELLTFRPERTYSLEEVAAVVPPAEVRTSNPVGTEGPQHSIPKDTIREMLKVIPPQGDYQEHWLTVLMAIHSEWGDEGVELAEKFASFKFRGNGISGATLYRLAVQHGYQVIKSELANGQHINKRYLEAADIPLDKRLTCIKSDRNTGKTQAISEAIESKHRVLVVGHRRTLLQNLAQRFKTDYYLDIGTAPRRNG